MNGAGRRRSRATTATRRDSRSPRSPGGSDGLRPPSRHTCMTRLMLTKDLRIAPRANAGLGAPRAAYGASRGTRSPLASAGQNARRYAWRRSPSPDPGRRSSVRQGRYMRAYGSQHPGAAPVWHAQADSAACRPVSTEPPGRSEGVPALRGARLWHRRAVSARHTHPPASSRAERLRLCEPHNPPTARRVGRRRRAGLPSARSSSLRSASPVLRDWSKGGSTLARIEQALAPPSS